MTKGMSNNSVKQERYFYLLYKIRIIFLKHLMKHFTADGRHICSSFHPFQNGFHAFQLGETPDDNLFVEITKDIFFITLYDTFRLIYFQLLTLSLFRIHKFEVSEQCIDVSDISSAGRRNREC